MRAADRLPSSTDFWRLTPKGKVTLIRPYWEDKQDWNQHIGLVPGTWLSPHLQVRAVAEFVRHAQAFAEKFDIPVTVNFLCEWRGLTGRTLYNPGSYFSIGGNATANGRRTSKEVTASALVTNWPEVVCDLVSPAIRLFNSSFKVTPEWVLGQAPSWLRL